MRTSWVETLATFAWVRAKETLLIQGSPRVGKTHLSVALGVRAIENGFSVTFYRFEELLAALRADAELPPARLRRRKYLNVALLVIDEMGFEPMTRTEASLFFRLVSCRYDRGSILSTTNKGIKELAGTARRRPGPGHRYPRPDVAMCSTSRVVAIDSGTSSRPSA